MLLLLIATFFTYSLLCMQDGDILKREQMYVPALREHLGASYNDVLTHVFKGNENKVIGEYTERVASNIDSKLSVNQGLGYALADQRCIICTTRFMPLKFCLSSNTPVEEVKADLMVTLSNGRQCRVYNYASFQTPAYQDLKNHCELMLNIIKKLK